MAGIRFYRAIGDVLGIRRRLALRQAPIAARNFKVSGDRSTNYSISLAPKPKFLYFVEFHSSLTPDKTPSRFDATKLSNTKDGMNSIAFQAKEVDRPTIQPRTENLNQYNKKRIIQTGIDYQPMTITFHDDISNNVIRFWSDYYAYYFGQGLKENPNEWRYDVVDNVFAEGMGNDGATGTGWGYRGHFPIVGENTAGGNKYYFSSIQVKIFYGGAYTSIYFVNPIITDVNQVPLEYADGGTGSELSITFDYEGVIYDNDLTFVIRDNDNLDEGLTRQNTERASNFGFHTDYYNISPSGSEQFPDAFISGDPVIDFLKSRGIVDNVFQGVATRAGVPPTTASIISGSLLRGARRVANGDPVTGSMIKSEAISFGVNQARNALGSNLSLPQFADTQNAPYRPSIHSQAQGVSAQTNNLGQHPRQPTGDAITGTPPIDETGISYETLTYAAGELNTVRGNVNPASLESGSSNARTVSNDFQSTFGATGAIAVNQNVAGSVSSNTNSITNESLNDDALVNKLPDGRYTLTRKGASTFNSVRSGTSSLGTKVPTQRHSERVNEAVRQQLDAEIFGSS